MRAIMNYAFSNSDIDAFIHTFPIQQVIKWLCVWWSIEQDVDTDA